MIWNHYARLRSVASLSIIPWTVIATVLSSTAATQPGAHTTEDLIRQLGSEDFEVREQATKQLLQREEAEPALRVALLSADAETVRRAKLILDHFGRRPMQRLVALCKNGQVMEAAELFIRSPQWEAEDPCWESMHNVACKLVEKEKQKYGTPTIKEASPISGKGPFLDFLQTVDLVRVAAKQARLDDDQAQSRWFLVRAEDIDARGCLFVRRSLLVCSGTVQPPKMISNCILFTGGDFEGIRVYDSVFVCEGNVTLISPSDSLIIARGEVWVKGNLSNCRIISSARVHLDKGTKNNKSAIVEKEPTPLGFVKWFDPGQAGITVEANKEEIRVKTTDDKKCFARAGIRPGDVLVAFDGTEVKSPESFRRLLRAKVATREEMVLKVNRDGKVMDIKVRCKD